YLIVNTLKLGFIVTIYYNFDRTDGGEDDRTFSEDQVNALFTMTLLTSFFWFLVSIWMIMHAKVVAQSLSTKMLLQRMRIPFPSTTDIIHSVKNAEQFETDLEQAFRFPVLSDLFRPARRAEQESSVIRQPTGISSSTNGISPFHRQQSGPVNSPGQAEANLETGVQSFSISVLDLLYGGAFRGTAKEELETMQGREPHLKLFRLIRSQWSAYDLYGQIAMQIGSAQLLSGLAYFSLYYLRDISNDQGFRVPVSGWFAFAFLELTAWWSLVLDVSLGLGGHLLLALLMLGSPMCLFFHSGASYFHVGDEILPILFAVQASWVLLLCWASVTCPGRWPRLWKASQYVDVLHREDCPYEDTDDVPRSHRKSSFFQSGNLESDSSDVSSSEFGEPASSFADAQFAATPLLDSLDAVLQLKLPRKLELKLARVRTHLYAAARTAGAFRAGVLSFRPVVVDGFWLKLDGFRGMGDAWVDPSRGNGSSHERGERTEVTVEDLCQAAEKMAETLWKSANTWTTSDMQHLAEYGGEPVHGISDFVGQFHKDGALFVGGRRYYLGGVVITTILWIAALVWSFSVGQTVIHAGALHKPAAPLRIELSLPWLAPVALGCDGGDQIVLADTAAGAFVGSLSNSSKGWLGPFSACGDADTAASDFGPGGQLWMACPDSLRPASSAEQWAGGPSRESGRTSVISGIQALALDPLPLTGTPLGGLALRHGKLVGLSQSLGLKGEWKMLGTMSVPSGLEATAVALYAGRGLILDAGGSVFELDTASGQWLGPWSMPTGFTWLGICALPPAQSPNQSAGGWLALGRPVAAMETQLGQRAPRAQLWRFGRPVDKPLEL
ncbi:unnamed protein product, partial [Polarella glacialis]